MKANRSISTMWCLAVVSALAVLLSGCLRLEPTAPQPLEAVADGSADRPAPKVPKPEEDEFVSVIDNPYMPLIPGTVFEYRGEVEGGVEIGHVHVTHDTRKIRGVICTVVLDSVYLDGALIEATEDWYAQDREGNVWYFGEDTKEFDERGKVASTDGTWRAGVRHAQQGIIMKAHPAVGDSYQQENAPGIAEDRAEVLAVDESVQVPYGNFTSVLKTRETTPLDPDIVEHKFYAPGVGFIKAQSVDGSEFVELIRVWNE